MKLEGVGLGSTSTGVARHELSSAFGELGLVQLRPLLEAGGQALLVLDDEDVVAFASSTAATLLGTAADKLEHRSLRDYASLFDTVPPFRGGAFPDLPLLVQARDGLRRVVLEGADGRRSLATLTVLHDRRGTATHLCLTLEGQRSPRPIAGALDALGRLAAELGHEINNQLAAALNYGSIVQRRVGTGTPEAEHLNELQQALWRASGWASSLRLIGRQRSPAPELLRMDQVLLELEPLLCHVAGDVPLRLALDARASVHVPRAFFEQVAVGVLAHALGRAGAPVAVTVRTRVQTDPATQQPIVRLSFETDGERESVIVPPAQRNGARARGMLHRALKRCGARLHHDERNIWLDFRTV